MQKPEWIKLLVIAVIVLITSAVWLFLEIADEVLEGETDSFDTRILLAMRESDDRSDPLGPKWFEEMQRDITALGGIPVLTLFTVLCIGGMFISGHRRTAYFIFFAVVGGALFALSLKSGFDRPRPDLVTHETQIYSRSFPSGHAMISTVTYLTIGLLLAGSYKHKLLGGYIIAACFFIAFLVGFSRIYLGVHWPTDVIAGWALGCSWALLCWLIGYWLKRRSYIEPIV